MMRSPMILRSALLAIAILVAMPVSAQGSQQSMSAAIAQKAPVFTAITLFGLWVRMKTKSDKEQFKSKPADDYKKLLQSFNVFDVEFYKHLVMLVDKYVAGRQIKFVNVDIKREDGSMVKGKKQLSQEPYGALGLFDAYVLSQIKSFTDNLPALASLYILLGSPELAWQAGIKKLTP